jgi:hypothetical protein
MFSFFIYSFDCFVLFCLSVFKRMFKGLLLLQKSVDFQKLSVSPFTSDEGYANILSMDANIYSGQEMGFQGCFVTGR